MVPFRLWGPQLLNLVAISVAKPSANQLLMVSNTRELLPHRRFEHLIHAALLDALDLQTEAQFDMIDIDRRRGVPEQRLSVHEDVIWSWSPVRIFTSIRLSGDRRL